MANRNELKSYFKTGAVPTEAQFAALIDATLHRSDDGLTVTGKGDLSLGGTLKATRVEAGEFAGSFAGNGAGLTNIPATAIQGTLPFPTDLRVPADRIVGTLSEAQVPGLDAAKITRGVLSLAVLPEWPQEKLPRLDASRIVSGVLDPARLPSLEQLPALRQVSDRLAKLEGAAPGGSPLECVPLLRSFFSKSWYDGRRHLSQCRVVPAFEPFVRNAFFGYESPQGSFLAFESHFVGMLLLVQPFSAKMSFPFLEFDLAAPQYIDRITFYHQHNHTGTADQYRVQVQLAEGNAAFANIGAPFLARAEDYRWPRPLTVIQVQKWVDAGRHRVRWIPVGLPNDTTAPSANFGLISVTLHAALLPSMFDRMP